MEDWFPFDVPSAGAHLLPFPSAQMGRMGADGSDSEGATTPASSPSTCRRPEGTFFLGGGFFSSSLFLLFSSFFSSWVFQYPRNPHTHTHAHPTGHLWPRNVSKRNTEPMKRELQNVSVVAKGSCAQELWMTSGRRKWRLLTKVQDTYVDCGAYDSAGLSSLVL